MSEKLEDLYLWEALKKTVKPLKNNDNIVKKQLKKISVPWMKNTFNFLYDEYPKTPFRVLDLHGCTCQEAFEQVMSFIKKHTNCGTKQVEIITGKGHTRIGQIKSEILQWLDHPSIRKYLKEVQWQHDGGSLRITFKKKKLDF